MHTVPVATPSVTEASHGSAVEPNDVLRNCPPRATVENMLPTIRWSSCGHRPGLTVLFDLLMWSQSSSV